VPHALKGGVRTVFMFAQLFSMRWGTLNHIVMYSYSGRDIDTTSLCDSLRKHFPRLRFTVNVFRRGVDQVTQLPASNASFCTLWTTAYLQLKYNQTARKFYLMQDYEPNFYPAGNVYGVIEQTYRFGFSCIANTAGVGNRYRQYSDDVTVFSPGVDRQMFFPDPDKETVGNPARVVFYGRPSNPRNCFLLGAETLKALKRKMGAAVEIISVGEDWDEDEFDLDGVLENRGLLGSLEEVAALYRSADIGLVFMMTPHPSYQPLEYMASGCVTATNINEPNQWLLRDDNALLIAPSPELAAQQILELLSNQNRWQAIRAEALKCISKFEWNDALEIVSKRLMHTHD
jgi:glycosyltransferase involved in cell wall biosynthesis